MEGIAADLSSGTDSKNSSLSSSLKKSEPAIVFDDFFFVVVEVVGMWEWEWKE